MSGPSSKPSHTGHLVPESPTHFYHCIPGLFGKSIGVLALSPTSLHLLLSGFLIPSSFGGPNGNVRSRTLLTPSSEHTALVQPSVLFLQLCELSKKKKNIQLSLRVTTPVASEPETRESSKSLQRRAHLHRLRSSNTPQRLQ